MNCYFCNEKIFALYKGVLFYTGSCFKHCVGVHQTFDFNHAINMVKFFSPYTEKQYTIYLWFDINQTEFFYNTCRVEFDGILPITPENAKDKVKLYLSFK